MGRRAEDEWGGRIVTLQLFTGKRSIGGVFRMTLKSLHLATGNEDCHLLQIRAWSGWTRLEEGGRKVRPGHIEFGHVLGAAGRA